MSSGTLPPQAYTREMLMQAYQWLRVQPESIKEMAVTPDAFSQFVFEGQAIWRFFVRKLSLRLVKKISGMI